jgi:hypothetical protein
MRRIALAVLLFYAILVALFLSGILMGNSNGIARDLWIAGAVVGLLVFLLLMRSFAKSK